MGGGRMAWRDGSLLITVGDHGFDGVGRPLTVAQLDDQDYGKTRLIDITTGTVRPFTKGNRNPQGLYIDPAGRIWSTEHGPRGGDELNLLTEGGNYGWPFATYGTAYELLSWPPADTAAPDPSFIPPRFAWVPSVGISNLVGVNADRFPRWKGNLLVGSLAGQSLYRVAVEGTEVRYVERIPIGVQIRDIVEFPDGDLWIWTDAGHALTVRPASAELRAATAFQACSGCHRSAAGVAGGIGPNLAGIVGGGVAAQASYPGYSAALRQIGGTWTEQRLDAFLTDPAVFAPGTTMSYRVSSPEDRAAIIAYLRTPR
jgi:cytochrome c2